MEDVEIWRSAQQLVKMYGKGAKVTAALRAEKALMEGDTARFEDWNRVAQAADQQVTGSTGFASVSYGDFMAKSRSEA
jgi:hypothetical protein